MGIIVNKVEEAFGEFKENIENQKELSECIGGLIKTLVEVADKSVCYQFHRDILDEAIDNQLAKMEA